MLNIASEAEAKLPCKCFGVRMVCFDSKDGDWRSPGQPDKVTCAHQEARSKLQEEYRVTLRASELQKMRNTIDALKSR
jgi:hypothetical protein